MPEKCTFLNCTRYADKGSAYCVNHKKIYGLSTAVNSATAPKKVSAKQQEINNELNKLRPIFLKKHPKCEVKLSPNCTGKADCIHHTQGRGKNEVLNQETWKASCEPCNYWVEEHHFEAQQAGMKVSRHQISTK